MSSLRSHVTIRSRHEPAGEQLLEVRGLGVEFEGRAAVDDVSFEIAAGEVLGLVGESGSGKSTLARAVLRLEPVVRGTLSWHGTDLLRCKGAALRRRRRDLQMVFQDPLASLDPHMTVGETLAEPLEIFEPALGMQATGHRVAEMLERVGLPPRRPPAIRTSSAVDNASGSASRGR